MKVFMVLYLNVSIIMSQNLFFSEYIEGSSYNKALKIFNPTNNEMVLTGYELWKVTNSEGSWTEETGNGSYALDLSEYVIPQNDVLVICRTSFDIDNQSKCDLMNDATLNFNGDDAIALAYNGNIIDAIGIVNGDPGSGYDIAGETNVTKDHTLIRKSNISSGNTNWSASAGTNSDNSEWIVLEKDDFTNLGSHICSACNESPNICNDCMQDCAGVWGGSSVAAVLCANGDIVCNIKDCSSENIFGCTDETVCNYDSDTTENDGNCEYSIDCENICSGSATEDNCGTCDSDYVNDCTQDCSGPSGVAFY